ncbi:MAG: hypothetical protein RLZZ337_82 [Bacteroidota bacterium]|jgi:hypothetical protein
MNTITQASVSKNNSLLETFTDIWQAIDRKTLLWVSLFGVAFGLVECAVVVYIRELYYPNGFGFPLVAISTRVIKTELWREAATLLMLASVGYIAGKNKVQRFAYFLVSFAVWDIFYYVFLKLILKWPESMLTWDILFLLPIAWIGPVVAPIILSLLMIVLAILLLYKNIALILREWILLLSGAFVSIVSFTWEYVHFLSSHSHQSDTGEQIMHLSLTYVPQHYPWWIFFISLFLIGASMFLYTVRVSKRQRKLAEMQLFI